MLILKNEYHDEDLIDIEEDIFYAIKQASLPKDKNRLHLGKFVITVEYVDDSE